MFNFKQKGALLVVHSASVSDCQHAPDHPPPFVSYFQHLIDSPLPLCQ